MNMEHLLLEPEVLSPKLEINQEQSFTDFVFRNQLHRRMVIISGVVLLMQLVVYKIMFPYPNFIPDSYAYMEAAIRNSQINMWPVGYSKFLRVFSAFVKSDIALVVFQFFLIHAAVQYFLFTLLYFVKVGNAVKFSLVGFFILNPLLLLISNFVLADTLFSALSTIWLTQLIWLTLRPSRTSLWTQAVLLMLLFSIRYNALYYPVITAAVVLSCKLPVREKVLAIGLNVLFVGLFIWHNGNQYKDLTGTRQFSGFGGWQLATNALIMYSKMDPDEQEVVPDRFKEFQGLVVRHRDSLNALKVRPDSVAAIYYLWDDNSPVNKYYKIKYGKDTLTPYFKHWAEVSPFYADYGKYMILKHPISYIKYYLGWNLLSYSIPPIEFLAVNNMGSDYVKIAAKEFFGYKSQKIKNTHKDQTIAYATVVIQTVTNVFFVIGVLGFIMFGGLRKANYNFRRIVFLVGIVWICNLIFSVTASPIVMRYQIFPLIIMFPLGMLMFDYVLKSDAATK